MRWAPSIQTPRESNSARSLLPPCLICNPSISHTSYVLWKHRKCERSFSPGKCRGKGSSAGWSGQEAREGASTVGTGQQAKPSRSTVRLQAANTIHSAHPAAPAPSPSRQHPEKQTLHQRGCSGTRRGVTAPHSPSHPGVFHTPAWQGSSVRACPPHGGRWLWRHPELQEEVRMHLGERHHSRGCWTASTLCPCAHCGDGPHKTQQSPSGTSTRSGTFSALACPEMCPWRQFPAAYKEASPHANPCAGCWEILLLAARTRPL